VIQYRSIIEEKKLFQILKIKILKVVLVLKSCLCISNCLVLTIDVSFPLKLKFLKDVLDIKYSTVDSETVQVCDH